MVESIAELRKICGSKKQGETRYNRFFAYIGMPLVKLFLYTPITANQVTFLGLVISVIAFFFFIHGNYWLGIAAALLVYMARIMDAIDGNIARYRKQCTMGGGFLDGIHHGIMEPALMFLGIGIGEYLRSGNLLFLYLGFAAAFFTQATRCVIVNKEIMLMDKTGKNYEAAHIMDKVEKKSMMKWASEILAYPTLHVMEFLLIGTIFAKMDWIIIFYGILIPLRWFPVTVFLYYTIDHDYEIMQKQKK